MTATESAARSSAVTTLLMLGRMTLAILLLVLFLYRSIRRPLQRVTERSRDIANVQLPGVVASMRADVDAELPEVEAIPVTSKDEIGELVTAFNLMSSTAVGLVGEQAAARRSIADMFMNLGRRNQKLLNRLLRNLDRLERNEEDPDVLAALYDIDHITTRMRRNAESLLVLAGAEQSRSFAQPAMRRRRGPCGARRGRELPARQRDRRRRPVADRRIGRRRRPPPRRTHRERARLLAARRRRSR